LEAMTAKGVAEIEACRRPIAITRCRSCASEKQREFATEINIHFSGRENLSKPPVFVFPKILVCLDCGFSEFTTSESELARLAG
jgi:hypothetical protein